MVEAILKQSPDNQYQVMAFQSFRANKKAWCECCGEQGHKFYECPERLLGNNANIFCQHCGSKNHPTADCKEKSKLLIKLKIYNIEKKGVAAVGGEEMVIEEEYHNFLKELQVEKE